MLPADKESEQRDYIEKSCTTVTQVIYPTFYLHLASSSKIMRFPSTFAILNSILAPLLSCHPLKK